MILSLVDVAGANFRTDDDSDQLNTQFMTYLGVRSRYLPARLALARSLATPSAPPALPESADQGKVIKGDTLFGTGAALATWTALLVQRIEEEPADLRILMDTVARHWRRGLILLQEDWKQCENEPARFLRRLVSVAGLREMGDILPGASPATDGGTPVSVELPVGEISHDASSQKRFVWRMTAPGGSPHTAIMGGVGSGKTRTAVAMLKSLREQVRVPLIAFDFKGDLGETGDDSFSYRLDRLFGGHTVNPPVTPVPLDVLALPSRSEVEISFAAQRFLESFSRLKSSGVGAKQQAAIFEAVSHALLMNTPCRLIDILRALKDEYSIRGMTEDGATATMEEICRFPLFEPIEKPEEFFQKSRIIALPSSIPERSRGIIVNLTLDALDRYLNSLPEARIDENGNRALRIVCVIDEAHQILSERLPGLSSLIRKSRSKGGAIMLISQSPDDFSGEDDDFLAEMGLIAAFATNARPNQIARVIGKGTNLSNLIPGQCVVKCRGEVSSKNIIAWS